LFRGDGKALWVPIVFGWTAFLVWSLIVHRDQLSGHLLELGAWCLVIAAVNLLPVRGSQSAPFVADFPISTAAALIFSPLETALLAFVGSFGRAELTGKTDMLRAAYNRSQSSLSWFVGSVCAHAIVEEPSSSPYVVGLAFVSLLADSMVNYLLVGLSIAITFGLRLRVALAGMRIGPLGDFSLMFIAAGVIGATLAATYDTYGLWALPIFLPLVLLVRQALLRGQMFIDVQKAYREREVALIQMTQQIDRERAEERNLIAAELHDEVLQPLFNVNLMAHVLKRDLATGKLLEMEEDLPELVAATEAASGVVRNLVGDLRRSGLGSGGLTSALQKLMIVLADQTSVKMHSAIADANPSPPVQLALYQIAKEAIGNALRHANATNIWLELETDGPTIALTVRDDGCGFDPSQVPDDHFGLPIMRERAASIKGSLYLDTTPGAGCKVRVVVASSGPASA
jgi:two-component system, NarL family, sensor histidine kinase DegS